MASAKYIIHRIIVKERAAGTSVNAKIVAYPCQFCGGFHLGHNGEYRY